METLMAPPENHIYYFHIGPGRWCGTFSFFIHDWGRFWKDSIGIRYRFLALGMAAIQRVFGSSSIESTLRAHPTWGRAGVATNLVRIRKLGVTMYWLDEQYVLHPNGSDLFGHSRERFGPIPFLFRSRKRHPAQISHGGTAATYQDMPLLGTLWTGHYRVLVDRKRIDAQLTCAWGSASEIIARMGSGDSDMTNRAAIIRPSAMHQRVGLTTVIERLVTYREWYEARRDARATFTHAYLTITRVFAEQIPRRGFADPAWLEALDVAFAEEYFRALDAFDLGAPVPGGWRPAMDAMMAGRTSVFDELVISMAAHIVHDLPKALESVGLESQASGLSQVADFHLANEILQEAIDEIQSEVTRRYNPVLGWLDSLSGREDEILTNYGIRLGRAAAWYNAERLTDPARRDEALQSMVRSVTVIVQRVLEPRLLSPTAVLRLGRWLSQVSRTWPHRDEEM